MSCVRNIVILSENESTFVFEADFHFDMDGVGIKIRGKSSEWPIYVKNLPEFKEHILPEKRFYVSKPEVKLSHDPNGSLLTDREYLRRSTRRWIRLALVITAINVFILVYLVFVRGTFF